MKKIALLPGGFKPPHAGHYNMAKYLAKETNADVVVVKVGAKEREGVTREMSIQLWNLYKESDPDPISDKLLIQPSTSNSPVRDVYDFIEDTAPEGSMVFLGMGEKDINDSRFKNIGKFAEPRNITFQTTLVPPQAGGVSGTEMRGFIRNNQDTFFFNALPDHMSEKDKQDAWGIVTRDINEDLYDPNDHVSDYMKSSEYKAGMPDGSKKDITPSYKYKRGGLYGKMYNETVTDTDIICDNCGWTWAIVDGGDDLYICHTCGHDNSPVDEMMMGTMNNQEKAKHNKNMKRLSKDLKKQGNQYKEVPSYIKGTLKRKMYENYPPYKADQVQKTRYQASDTFTNSPKDAKKKGYLEGDTYEKMAAKGKKRGNLKQGTVRKRLKIKAGEKIPLSKINQAISRIKKMENPSEKNKKFLKALNLAKTLKTTTHKEHINEADPKKGTGKKPKGSGRRLYTDENPKDTVKVKFSTRQDIVDTLSKASFKSKSHARKSQIINLIHQRVRAAIGRAKDPAVKKRLRSAFEYIKKRKEASKRKTQNMKKESTFSKNWWKDVINEVLLVEGGAAGHMAHPFDLPNVTSGKSLLNVFNQAANSLQNNPGAVKIDGVNSSIRLVDLDGKKQFVMDRGSKKPLDIKGITKDDLLARFGDGHGMIKVGGNVLDMFNEALPAIQGDLDKLGVLNDPNILFNMEYVSGKTNVQDYGSNFIAIHGLNRIEMKDVQGARGPLKKRISTEVNYDKNALQSLLNNLEPIAKKRGFEVYGSVPTEIKKKPNFNAALSKRYTVEFSEQPETKSLGQWLNSVNNIPVGDFIFMNIGYQKGSSTINRKKVGAVSKQVYLAILNGENVDGLFENKEDRKKAIDGFVTYLATEKLGDEVLKVLDSPMGSVENHEGVVIRDEKIASVPFKITGKFILGGMASDF